MGRLGAAKRRMLSLADRPSPAGGWLSVGAAEGIVAGRASMDEVKLRRSEGYEAAVSRARRRNEGRPAGAG